MYYGRRCARSPSSPPRLALALAPAASAVGPWLGVVDGAEGIAAPNAAVDYVATFSGGATTVTAQPQAGGTALATAKVTGELGHPDGDRERRRRRR